MNRKGFTLVELLVTIAIIGIVLSLGTYFVMEVVENSKEKAYEATRKSVLESAVIYASEFLDETDWVEVSDEIDTDRSCVGVQWLINKGYVKKEDFNPSGITEDYKLNTDHVVVLKKDTKTKTIRYDDVYKSDEIDINENGTCNNLLNAEITSTSSTTNSITVNAKCSVKGITPSDIEYEFNIGGNNSGKIKNNSFTYEELKDGLDYNVSVKCYSSEYNETPSAESIVKTKSLPTPNITYEGNTVIINYNTHYIDNVNLIKSFSVDADEVIRIMNDEIISRELRYDSSSVLEYLSIAKVTADKVTITAWNSDGYEPNKKEVKKEISIEKKPVSEKPNTPVLVPDDGIGSGNWHKNNFNLSITSDNSSEVIYYYGTDIANLKEYSSEILISNESNSTTYYAKACSSDDLNNCSDHTSYIVKLDKTAPELDIEVKNTDNSRIDLVQDGNKYTNDNWIKARLNFGIKASDSLSGLKSNEVIFRYSPSKKKDRPQSLSGTGSISNDTTRAINEDGNRWYQFEICDIAGNCTIKDYFIKTDVTPPVVDASMGYSGVSGSANLLSCSGNTCNNDNWLNKYVTLYFNSIDTLSGLNNNAKFAYNYGYLSSLDETILDDEDAIFNNGSFTRDIYSDGVRYVTLNACDTAGNCTKKEVYFKIDTVLPVVSVNKNGNNYSITCRPSFSGVKVFSLWDSINNANNEKITGTVIPYIPSNSNNIKIELTCRNNAELYTNEKYEYTSSSGSSSNTNASCGPLESEECCKMSCGAFKRADGTPPWIGKFEEAIEENRCYCCEPGVTDFHNSPGRCFGIT